MEDRRQDGHPDRLPDLDPEEMRKLYHLGRLVKGGKSDIGQVFRRNGTLDTNPLRSQKKGDA